MEFLGVQINIKNSPELDPEFIPLHLFNRKFILDADDLYGEFQAGSDTTTPGPLTAYTLHDVEPAAGLERSRG